MGVKLISYSLDSLLNNKNHEFYLIHKYENIFSFLKIEIINKNIISLSLDMEIALFNKEELFQKKKEKI